MDTATLVDEGIDDDRREDGRKFVGQLVSKGFDVAAACWIKTIEEGRWFLYIASKIVDDEGLAAAYRKAYGVLRSIAAAGVAASEVKLIAPENPIVRDVQRLLREDLHPVMVPIRPPGGMIGQIACERAYIYPTPVPGETWPRLAFRVTYYRQGKTNHWTTDTERERLYRNIRASGAVSYSTAQWGGEADEDANFATVSVLLEIAPEYDDEAVLDHPDVRRLMTEQARKMADEMFRSRHPDAIIEHEDDRAPDG